MLHSWLPYNTMFKLAIIFIFFASAFSPGILKCPCARVDSSQYIVDTILDTILN